MGYLGWSGLAAAKHYKDHHSSHALAVLDYASSIGGVWAKHRHYPGLKSNNLLGTFEYPGFPMDTETFGIPRGQHPTAQAIHAYHTAFAERNGILGLVRCSTRVVSAEYQGDGGWILVVCPVADSDPKKTQGAETTISARRLIVATGLVSEPFMPHIEGQEVFDRPLFHPKDFLKYAGNPVDADKTKRVTVFGGSKSAWDAVYAYGTAGVKVDWVIRGRTVRNARRRTTVYANSVSLGAWAMLDGAFVRDAFQAMDRATCQYVGHSHPCSYPVLTSRRYPLLDVVRPVHME